MTLPRYLLGVLLAGVAIAPVCFGALMVRRRVLAGWSGALARLTEVIIGLGIVVVVTELLGTVGLYRLGPIVVALAGAGLTIGLTCRAGGSGLDLPRDHEPPRRDLRPLVPLIPLCATAVVLAEWMTRTSAAFRNGVFTYDSLWYHLPAAARFVQEGRLTELQFFEGQPATAFQPFNGSLLHGLGIMTFGNDLLSPLINLAFLALALLAAWCIGVPSGVAPLTFTGVAVVLGTPFIVATQADGGMTDIAAVAFLLASVAIIVNARPARFLLGPATLSVAGLAAGLAIGTKATAIAPVAVLTVGVVVLARAATRLRAGAMWLAGLVLGGGFWYVRNAVVTGNPLPTTEPIKLGPLTLDGPPVRTPVTAPIRYLFDGDVWRDHFLPGFDRFFGPAWWVVLVLVGAGLVLAVVAAPTHVHRVVGVAGIAAVAAYLVGPQILHYTPGDLFFLVTNLRYALPGIFLGVVLLPLVPQPAERAEWMLPVFAAILVATQFHQKIWPTEPLAGGIVRAVDALVAVVAGAVVLVIGAFLVTRRSHSRFRRERTAVAIVAFAATVAGGFALQHIYLQRRYIGAEPRHLLWEWAQTRHDERIAVIGEVRQYPYYGKDLSNHVQYIGARGPNGAFAPITECSQWRRALNAGRYTYAVIAPERVPVHVGIAPELAWIRNDPAATLVMTEGDTSLFRLDRPLQPNGCTEKSGR